MFVMERVYMRGYTVPDAGEQDVVDSAQFDVDLEAEVGQRLWRRLVDVLGLNALRRQSEHDVSDAFHLSCKINTH